MKRQLLLNIVLIFIAINIYAQAPMGFNYQAIARDFAGQPITTTVAVRISILDSSATGQVLYTEVHHPIPDNLGLFNLVIGQGTVSFGTFANINWGAKAKFTKVEMDPANGTNFSLIGTSQLLSVPYALLSKSSADWKLTGGNLITNIGTTGNVGINESNPGSKFTVSKDGILGNNIGDELQIGDFGFNSAGNWNYLRIKARRHVDPASVTFPWMSAETRIEKIVDAVPQGYMSFKSDFIQWGIGNTDHMTLSSSGYLGIGTASPTYALTINAGGNNLLFQRPTITDSWDMGIWGDGAFRIGLIGQNEDAIHINNNLGISHVSINSNTGQLVYMFRVYGQAGGSSDWVNLSDIKFKKNIQAIQNPLDILDKINGKFYEYRASEFPEMFFRDGIHCGVIAQEVEKVLPGCVSTDSDGSKGVAYTEFVPVLIEAVKALKKQNELLLKRIEMLEHK